MFTRSLAVVVGRLDPDARLRHAIAIKHLAVFGRALAPHGLRLLGLCFFFVAPTIIIIIIII